MFTRVLMSFGHVLWVFQEKEKIHKKRKEKDFERKGEFGGQVMALIRNATKRGEMPSAPLAPCCPQYNTMQEWVRYIHPDTQIHAPRYKHGSLAHGNLGNVFSPFYTYHIIIFLDCKYISFFYFFLFFSFI